MNDILLSVIVPVYNGGHYLPNLINSIIDKNNELTKVSHPLKH